MIRMDHDILLSLHGLSGIPARCWSTEVICLLWQRTPMLWTFHLSGHYLTRVIYLCCFQHYSRFCVTGIGDWPHAVNPQQHNLRDFQVKLQNLLSRQVPPVQFLALRCCLCLVFTSAVSLAHTGYELCLESSLVSQTGRDYWLKADDHEILFRRFPSLNNAETHRLFPTAWTE